MVGVTVVRIMTTWGGTGVASGFAVSTGIFANGRQPADVKTRLPSRGNNNVKRSIPGDLLIDEMTGSRRVRESCLFQILLEECGAAGYDQAIRIGQVVVIPGI